MPYIKQEDRACLDDVRLEYLQPASPGELHYCIAMLINSYLERGLSYTTLNDVMGVLACAQQEVYRRIAAPYEDQKIAENGEVFFIRVPKEESNG